MVTALVNQLQVAPEELTLVLDDYHLIDTGSIHDGMAFLLGHLPPQLHVVITSRSDPPLPLARLRARGRWPSCGPPTCGSPPRSRRPCGGGLGLDLPERRVAALAEPDRGVGGGPAAYRPLAAGTPGPRSAFLVVFAGTHRYVLDYLSEEVLERQPDRVRTFLLETSILERLSGPLCDAVTGRFR